MAIALEVAALNPDIVLAVREEIDLKLDPATYQALSAEQRELVRRTMERFIKNSAEPLSATSATPPSNNVTAGDQHRT